MNKRQIFRFIILGGLICSIAACKGSEKSEDTSQDTLDKDTSYAFGMALAFSADFKGTGLKFDYDAFTRGFKEYLEGQKTEISLDEAMVKVQTTYSAVMNAQSETLRRQELEFLAENSKKAGITITASGLQYELITQGNGQKPAVSDKVRVHYKGTLIDGTVFDSSYSRGEPAEFSLTEVIPGWTEGLQLMEEGSSCRFYIPSALAYGEQGAGNTIPPYSTLIFEVELLSIIK